MEREFPFQDLYPFASRFLTLKSGHKLHYVDEGRGPVLILIHGNPTWSFYYRDLIKRLSATCRVIAPDHIGCGLSDHPKGKHFRAKDRVAHLQELVDHLGIKSFSLGMHDWGGSIGTSLAANNIPRIEKLVYFNTTLTETESLPFFIRISAKPPMGKFITKTTKTFLRLATDVGVGKKLPKRVKQGYMYPYRTNRDRTAIWDFVQDIPFDIDHPTYAGMMEISRAIPELAKKPIKIMWGLKDPCFHHEMLTQLVRLFPNAEVTEFPNASHLVVEDEIDNISRSLEEFFLRPNSELKQRSNQIERAPLVARSLYDLFLKEAESKPFKDAVVIPRVLGNSISYRHMNYGDMKNLVHRYHRGLVTLGLKQGDRVLFLVKPGVDFLALSYAVMAEGAVPVFIDPGIEKAHLFKAIADIQADVFIGTQKAHILRMLKKDLFKGIRFHILAQEWGISGGPNLSVLRRFSSTPAPDSKYSEIGMIAFTSGATGVPKGVIFTQKMLLEQIKVFREQFGILPDGRDLPLLPIFSLFQLANGVTSVIPPMDPAAPLSLDPSKMVKIIQDLNITYSFGSPTLWRKISDYCLRVRTTLPTLKRVFMAGAAVPIETVKNVVATLGEAPVSRGLVYTPYGATEALPVTVGAEAEILENKNVAARDGEVGTFVGAPIQGVDLRIISPVTGEIREISEVRFLSAREIGEIIVRGATVSPSYLNRPDADRLGKIKDGQDFWHRMGDLGYLDESGRLYYCGRKSHLVTYEGKEYHSVPIENLFSDLKGISRVALVSVKGEPGLVIEPEPGSWPESEAARQEIITRIREIALKSPLTNSIKKFFLNPSLPVDRRHNAKIYRDRLGEWAEKEERRLNRERRAANG
jgi:acyl-CoA synthetase (AMP-forming)/AMP-acid ligase II/pimeloyl-ACP methyl ester carboxylesterase